MHLGMKLFLIQIWTFFVPSTL